MHSCRAPAKFAALPLQNFRMQCHCMMSCTPVCIAHRAPTASIAVR
jgi:hypothetical protein